ncbi:hypothetical protein [Plantactinospora sonchi]|uniref:WXG100 family type VII secretion target n=1 Tax=Plantactinospora sonchi TaxID=1544735 RepID=A0ABU7RQT8_9ACTN
MPSRDYFTYAERPDGQSVSVGSPQSTRWEKFPTFFHVKGVILAEKPDGPAALAEAYSQVRAKLQKTADQLDARGHGFHTAWSDGPASENFFRLTGATLYSLDHWVENLDDKIERLAQLAGDISDAHGKAEELEQQFKAEYESKAPAGAGFYGFPPNLSLDNPALDNEAEEKLKARIAAVYQEVHDKYLKLIIKLGQRLAKDFVEAATWMGSAGKVPARFQGPDKAKPWQGSSSSVTSTTVPSSPNGRPLSRSTMSSQPSDRYAMTLFAEDPNNTAPMVTFDAPAAPPTRFGEYGTEAPVPGGPSVEQRGFGPTTGQQQPVGTVPTAPAAPVGVPGSLGRGFVGPLGTLPPHTTTPSRAGEGPGWSALPAGSPAGQPGPALAGRFGEPVAVPPSTGELAPSALSARGGQPALANPVAPSGALLPDGPMASPAMAASGWSQVLSARAAVTTSVATGKGPAVPERNGVIGERRAGRPEQVEPARRPTPVRTDQTANSSDPVDKRRGAIRRTPA